MPYLILFLLLSNSTPITRNLHHPFYPHRPNSLTNLFLSFCHFDDAKVMTMKFPPNKTRKKMHKFIFFLIYIKVCVPTQWNIYALCAHTTQKKDHLSKTTITIIIIYGILYPNYIKKKSRHIVQEPIYKQSGTGNNLKQERKYTAKQK